MTSNVVEFPQEGINEAAKKTVGTSYESYDFIPGALMLLTAQMHPALMLLTAKMLWAFEATLHENVEERSGETHPQTKAILRMIGDAVNAFDAFRNEYYPEGHDENSAIENQKKEQEQSEEWINAVLNSLPPLPSVG